MTTVNDLKKHAIAASLFRATTLKRAIARLGFVQADPIRAPARAQDLILRHRVAGYQVGDLEKSYTRLKLEEDSLYAYGFMPLETWRLLHPRGQRTLSAAERKVLEVVQSHKRLHPRELQALLGVSREVNAWGGYSRTTTRCLERLHYLGLIRIAGREKGVRLYRPSDGTHEPVDSADRLRQLALLTARILAPVPESSLRATLQHFRYSAPNLEGRKTIIKRLLESGSLDSAMVDGVRWLWPAGRLIREEPEAVVRFLAPFDPLVWDRRRFEQFWGWPYRFEAYTPIRKRKMGYYAMPLLWRSEVIGWVNVSGSPGNAEVKPGFVSGKHASDKGFKRAFEAEVESLRRFLVPRES